MNEWERIVKAALLGTERQPLPTFSPDTPLGQLLDHINNAHPEQALLNVAGTVDIYRQLGQRPPSAPAASHQPAPPDHKPVCSGRAAYMLNQLLFSHYRGVLPEFLRLLAQAGQRIPDEQLPALLSHGRRTQSQQPLILPVIGQRGRWLAQHNPQWFFASFDFEDDDQLRHQWKIAPRPERQTLLHLVRHRQPEKARALLHHSWKTELPQDRLQFLRLFQTNLSMADEPFLEEVALQDRSQLVRRKAAEFLACLPQSRLCQRMAARTAPHLQWHWLTRTLTVTLPEKLDDDLLRDGLIQTEWRSRIGQHGWRLTQMLAATPLEIWTEKFNTTADLLVMGVKKAKWQRALIQGLALAAERQQNNTWALALLHHNDFTSTANRAVTKLVAVLSPAEREQLALQMTQTYGTTDKLQRHHPFIIVLEYSDHVWSAELTRAFVHLLHHEIKHSETNSNPPDQMFRKLLHDFACRIPPTLVGEVEQQLQPVALHNIVWRPLVAELIATLRFRQEMQRELGVSK